ncbi:MAG: phage holin family protein [Phormidesmis sp.]
MLGILLPALVTAISLLIIDWLLPGVALDTVTASLLAAASIGIVNAVIKPIIKLLSLPLTVVTFGLFSLVVNGFCFWLASVLVPGFHVYNLFGFVAGPLALSFLSTTLGHYAGEALGTRALPEATE